jgi:tetratricopeptide (TPR) repeat protein
MLLLATLCLCGTTQAAETPNEKNQTVTIAEDQISPAIQALEAEGQSIMIDPDTHREEIKAFIPRLLALLESPQAASLSPLDKSCIQLLLGRSYCCIYDIVNAITWLDQSLAFLSQYYKDNPNPRLRFAIMYRGVAARHAGDYTGAKNLLEQSVKQYEENPPPDPLSLAFALNHLTYIYKSVAEYDKAKAANKRSIEIYKEYDPQNSGLVFAYSNLATVYSGSGDFVQAIDYQLKSLDLLRKRQKPDPHGEAFIYVKLGMNYRHIGDYAKAKEALTTGYSSFKKYDPENTADSLSWATTELGQIYRLLGDEKLAATLLQESVDLTTKHLGDDQILTDWARVRLGQFYMDTGKYEEAKALLERCLAGYQKAYGNIPDKMAWVYHPLALVYMYLGEMDKALMYFKKTEQIHAEHYGTVHTDYALFMKDFGLYYLFTGDYKQAESIFTAALKILSNTHHIECYRCFEYLGDLYKKTGDLRKSLAHYEAALRIIQAVFPANSFHKERLHAKVQDLGPVIVSHL